MNNQLSSERLKELRESRKLSHDKLRTALCEKYGDEVISSAALKNYEAAAKGEYHSKYFAIESITAKNLYMLADFYGVSVDYVLGLSDAATNDAGAAAAVEYTGLSLESINKLVESRQYLLGSVSEPYRYCDFVNYCLTSDDFSELYGSLMSYFSLLNTPTMQYKALCDAGMLTKIGRTYLYDAKEYASKLISGFTERAETAEKEARKAFINSLVQGEE